MSENNLEGSGFPEKLAKPAKRALEGAGYFTLEQLAGATEAELLDLHGMGPNAMGKLRKAMADNGLSFKGK
ncbi:DNA-binding protein [Sporosarcina globispora]|uniref:DNA-binding protein n=1 Tax=Sporosarcina globispora TaxID=1459 RepID=A0A0M0GD20_SPOGL|nr:DNA-binding protein [Sporosarcina globispora]KON87744.1 DNA-binding protein [Sporosarcina globispora]